MTQVWRHKVKFCPCTGRTWQWCQQRHSALLMPTLWKALESAKALPSLYGCCPVEGHHSMDPQHVKLPLSLDGAKWQEGFRHDFPYHGRSTTHLCCTTIIAGLLETGENGHREFLTGIVPRASVTAPALSLFPILPFKLLISHLQHLRLPAWPFSETLA